MQIHSCVIWHIHVCKMTHLSVYVLLCFMKPILWNRYGPGVSSKAGQGAHTHGLYRQRATSSCPLEFRKPWVAGSSPFTLTTSLPIPIPSTSSSNGPITTTLKTKGLCTGWGPRFVRPHESGFWVVFRLGVKGLRNPSPPTTQTEHHFRV